MYISLNNFSIPPNIRRFLHRFVRAVAWMLRVSFKIASWPLRHPVGRYLLLVLFAGTLVAFMFLLKDLPSPRRLTSEENFPVSTQLFDRNGVLLYEIIGDEHRIPVKIDTIPEYVVQATIAIEDKNFYRHWGFDVEGIARALRANLTRDTVHGGSTITQQLVKNALLTSEKSLQRKIKEAVLSVITEILYSKQEIMEMYLNYIPYGGTAVGIEAASQEYFDKSAHDLTLSEAAFLSGLPQAPSSYSPYGSTPERGKARQQEVLRRMVEDNYISQESADAASKEPLKLALKKTDIKAPHFVFYIQDLLFQEYGEEKVRRGGFRVHTTLDYQLQETVEASVSAQVAKLARMRVSNGAALVANPATGEILAMVGSKDYFDTEIDGQVNITLASRQPGSSIKPLTYAVAFQKKLLNPGSVLLDIATCFKNPGQRDYCPKNYNGSFSGPVTVRHSLGNSLNIPAVKALKILGLRTFIDEAQQLGISSWTDYSQYGLALTLGGGEVRMLDMAQAFSVLANQGVKVPLGGISNITDYTGKEIMNIDMEQRKKDLAELTEYDAEKSQGDLKRILDRAPSYLTAHIMQDNSARSAAFGARSSLVIPNQIVSVKTGTTNDLKDNWTIGFTSEYLVATWVGNNDSTAMSSIVSGVTGAAPIWNDIMTFILRGKGSVLPEKPLDVMQGAVCATGLPPALSKEPCQPRSTDLFWKSSQPTESKVERKNSWIRPETGLPPLEGEQVEGLILQEHEFITDPLTKEYCATCSRPVGPDGKVVFEKNIVE